MRRAALQWAMVGSPPLLHALLTTVAMSGLVSVSHNKLPRRNMYGYFEMSREAESPSEAEPKQPLVVAGEWTGAALIWLNLASTSLM